MHCLGEDKRGTYSCASNDDVTERMSSATIDWKTRHRSAMVQLLGGVYGLTIVILGFVFALAAALTLGRETNDSYYLEALQVFLFSMSLFFLVYLHAYLLRSSSTSQTSSGAVGKLELPTDEKSAEKINLEELDSGGENDKPAEANRSKSATPVPNTHSLPRSTLTRKSRVTFDGKSVNFYLRLGIIVFGTGTMVHDGFRLSQLLQEGQLSFRCVSRLDVAVISLHILFTFSQTFYLFKSHKIVVWHQRGLTRFGFIHLIATNVCVAIVTILDEIHNDVMANLDGSQSTNQTVRGCVVEKNLSWKTSPYLFPFSVQYSLIAVAIVCQMHRNISTAHAQQRVESRVPPLPPQHDNSSTRDVTDDDGGVATATAQVNCDKAHKGLFLGLLVVVLTLVAVSCYFVFGAGRGYFRGPDDADFYSGFIFFFTELALLLLATVAVVLGFVQFRRLRFSPVGPGGAGDQPETALLVFALSGVIAMKSFHSVAAVSAMAIRAPERDLPGLLAVVTAAAVLVEVLLQTVFLADTLRRSVQSAAQRRAKPGRAVVTFLLLVNAALLVVSVFESEKAEYERVYAPFYGRLAWSSIRHLTVPVQIFYRFHSVVCVSEIWTNAYRIREK